VVVDDLAEVAAVEDRVPPLGLALLEVFELLEVEEHVGVHAQVLLLDLGLDVLAADVHAHFNQVLQDQHGRELGLLKQKHFPFADLHDRLQNVVLVDYVDHVTLFYHKHFGVLVGLQVCQLLAEYDAVFKTNFFPYFFYLLLS